jgi:hypothetical protein
MVFVPSLMTGQQHCGWTSTQSVERLITTDEVLINEMTGNSAFFFTPGGSEDGVRGHR